MIGKMCADIFPNNSMDGIFHRERDWATCGLEFGIKVFGKSRWEKSGSIKGDRPWGTACGVFSLEVSKTGRLKVKQMKKVFIVILRVGSSLIRMDLEL